MWSDGNSWHTLENIKNVNKGSYSFKTFNLPSNAGNNPNFQIKFECTSGAVNDYCRLDNVNVTAN